MRSSLRLSLVLVFLCASAARPEVAPSEAEISAKLCGLLRSHVGDAGPGAVAVVAKNGVIVGQCAMGAADVENNRPMTTHTVFDLASCSKQFTAMAIMILAERGKLTFEDQARKFLPELATHDPAIRVVDLLHMTSGLPDYPKLLDHLEDKSNLDVLHAVAGRPLSSRLVRSSVIVIQITFCWR